MPADIELTTQQEYASELPGETIAAVTSMHDGLGNDILPNGRHERVRISGTLPVADCDTDAGLVLLAHSLRGSSSALSRPRFSQVLCSCCRSGTRGRSWVSGQRCCRAEV